MSTNIMGIDQSALATAVVCAPLDWDGRWERVKSTMAGAALERTATDEARARRCDYIASKVVAFAKHHAVEIAWFESYGFNKKTAAHTIAEVGGVLRLELVRAGVEIRTANMSAARKLLLGKLPRNDAKGAVFKTLHDAGARFETLDLADAFTCLNWGMSELGGYCFAQVAA